MVNTLKKKQAGEGENHRATADLRNEKDKGKELKESRR